MKFVTISITQKMIEHRNEVTFLFTRGGGIKCGSFLWAFSFFKSFLLWLQLGWQWIESYKGKGKGGIAASRMNY